MYNYTYIYMYMYYNYIITVFYRDYAHPNCMLHSSYRWDGLDFEIGSFVLKLRPSGCLPRNYEETKSFPEACQRLNTLQQWYM